MSGGGGREVLEAGIRKLRRTLEILHGLNSGGERNENCSCEVLVKMFLRFLLHSLGLWLDN